MARAATVACVGAPETTSLWKALLSVRPMLKNLKKDDEMKANEKAVEKPSDTFLNHSWQDDVMCDLETEKEDVHFGSSTNLPLPSVLPYPKVGTGTDIRHVESIMD